MQKSDLKKGDQVGREQMVEAPIGTIFSGVFRKDYVIIKTVIGYTSCMGHTGNNPPCFSDKIIAYIPPAPPVKLEVGDQITVEQAKTLPRRSVCQHLTKDGGKTAVFVSTGRAWHNDNGYWFNGANADSGETNVHPVLEEGDTLTILYLPEEQ